MKTMFRFTFEVEQAMPNFSLERTPKSVILFALQKSLPCFAAAQFRR